MWTAAPGTAPLASGTHLRKQVDSSTSTMLEMSSGFLPHRCSTREADENQAPALRVTGTTRTLSSSRPASDWRAPRRTRPALSQSSAKLTPPLHKLQTPSYRMIGRRSSAKKESPACAETQVLESWRRFGTRNPLLYKLIRKEKCLLLDRMD